ncbi:MAG: bifunctional metallophosphatase/5'-nucleotidase [Bacteroidales bacterium]|nr:bifunctional metallophosphatase/5'-nucleotidase [Bacteroidales bacterium]
MRRISILFLIVASALACNKIKDGDYTLHVLTTNDVHGTWFDSTYTDGNQKKSLMAISQVVNRFRDSVGAENVILIDAGDCLQGDNAPYYFNYVDTVSPHLFPRLLEYMKYDAVAVGNHDIETGHDVFDRVASQMEEKGIPFLGGNAIKDSCPVSEEDGEKTGYSFEDRYFPVYKIVERGGLKVAILGYSNPNMKAWLDESVFSGIHFVSLIPLVQQDVDKVIQKEKPQVVIVAIHSGTGDGKGNSYESQGLDLLNSLTGVDFVVCSHDHRPYTAQTDSICLINSGSHSKNVGHGTITLKVKKGKVVEKKLSAENIESDLTDVDTVMRNMFRPEFLKVKEFTLTEVGTLDKDMATRDSYRGMSYYMNLIHTVGLASSGAEISIAAPLTYNRTIKAGSLVYNDLFTIYPFENQMFVITMSGRELKDYLEASYDKWIMADSTGHLLKIQLREDPRNNQEVWSFVNRSYNFDSAAGIYYSVDITMPRGERVKILSMADGTPFDMDKTYKVAMTSYRASGGGGLLDEIGIETDRIDERIVAKFPEYRDVIYRYLQKHKQIKAKDVSNRNIIGGWEFIPHLKAKKLLDQDMKLLFGEE